MLGPVGYGGMDQLGDSAEELRGIIEMVDLDQPSSPVVVYGSSGPLVYRIGYVMHRGEDGALVEHWVFVKSCIERRAWNFGLPRSAPDDLKITASVDGDKILVLQEAWLERILCRMKVLEIRHVPLKAGIYFLGCRSQIRGIALTLPPVAIKLLSRFRDLLPPHGWDKEEFPYKTTQ